MERGLNLSAINNLLDAGRSENGHLALPAILAFLRWRFTEKGRKVANPANKAVKERFRKIMCCYCFLFLQKT
jgi:hypothetical protein